MKAVRRIIAREFGGLGPLIDWTDQMKGSGRAGSTVSRTCSRGWTNDQSGRRPAPKETDGDGSPPQLIDGRIKALDDWRGETLARVRALIKEADPEMVEEWKWRGVPVWSHGGILCTGETYKGAVKLTFAKGAALDDP